MNAFVTEPHPPMPIRSTDVDGTVKDCGRCDQGYGDRVHAPAAYLANLGPYHEAIEEATRRIAEGAGVPLGLLHSERASGPPRDPSADAMAATYEGTALPPRAVFAVPAAMHALDPANFVLASPESQAVTVDVLHRLGAVEQPRNHPVGKWGMKRNGITTEVHPCGDDEPHVRHLWQPGPKTEWFTCDGEVCTHPNGFDVTGCPCGASAPDEDDEPIIRPNLQPIPALLAEAMADVTRVVGIGKEPVSVDPNQEMRDQLYKWWMMKAEEEADKIVPKAIEYGATDLRDIGRDLADCMNRKVTDEEAAELGIFFYLRGKLSRWVDAVKRGDRPSDDTIYDIGAYCRMAQRNRDAGSWPGV